MTDKLRIRRWTQHGHDRLYVTTSGGTKVGWYDLRTQRQHLDTPGMWPEFQQAIAEWRQQSEPSSAAPRAPRPRRRLKRDLAEQTAGAALQRRAERLQPRGGVRLLALLFGIRTADYAWRTGAAGERAVASTLDPLPERGGRSCTACSSAPAATSTT